MDMTFYLQNKITKYFTARLRLNQAGFLLWNKFVPLEICINVIRENKLQRALQVCNLTNLQISPFFILSIPEYTAIKYVWSSLSTLRTSYQLRSIRNFHVPISPMKTKNMINVQLVNTLEIPSKTHHELLQKNLIKILNTF